MALDKNSKIYVAGHNGLVERKMIELGVISIYTAEKQNLYKVVMKWGWKPAGLS